MQQVQPSLPAGLIYHCASCKLVIPSDAPTVAGADCAFVAKHKLAWFNAKETPAGQHVQAVATWQLIHDAPLKTNEPATRQYLAAFRASRNAHFAASAVRKAMTPAQIQAGMQHRRDGALYK